MASEVVLASNGDVEMDVVSEDTDASAFVIPLVLTEGVVPVVRPSVVDDYISKEDGAVVVIAAVDFSITLDVEWSISSISLPEWKWLLLPQVWTFQNMM